RPGGWRGSSISRAGRRRTTPRSSSPGTTTTRSGGRSRRRSSAAPSANTAPGGPNRKRFASRPKGYHGVPIVAASLTGLPNNHRDFDLPVPGIRHLSTPHHWEGDAAGRGQDAEDGR